MILSVLVVLALGVYFSSGVNKSEMSNLILSNVEALAGGNIGTIGDVDTGISDGDNDEYKKKQWYVFKRDDGGHNCTKGGKKNVFKVNDLQDFILRVLKNSKDEKLYYDNSSIFFLIFLYSKERRSDRLWGRKIS